MELLCLLLSCFLSPLSYYEMSSAAAWHIAREDRDGQWARGEEWLVYTAELYHSVYEC